MARNEITQHRTNWLRRLRSGDHCAFSEFVAKYEQSVFLCCRTLGLDQTEAEDVAAETFLAAYKALPRFAGRAKLSTWLLRIAYNKVITYLRKKGRHRQLLGNLDEQSADKYSEIPSADMEAEELRQTIWQAVNDLPKLWALAVILFYREEKSVSEVAKIMRKRENTVKTYLFRARKRLKQILTPAIGDDIDVAG